MSIIIKSGKKNWSGKEFSELPAKIYGDFDDVVSALNSYHFWEYCPKKNEYVQKEKMQRLTIIHLTESKRELLLSTGQARL